MRLVGVVAVAAEAAALALSAPFEGAAGLSALIAVSEASIAAKHCAAICL